MGHLTAISTAQVDEGFDAIDRAATIADVVSSVAVRGHAGTPGIGILSTYAVTATTETAFRIATAMGFRAHRIGVSSLLGRSIIDPPEGDEMIEGFHAELDRPAATFHVIETDQHDDVDQRVAKLVSAIVARRPAGARTSILVTMRGDVDRMTLATALVLRMDPDDVVVRIF